MMESSEKKYRIILSGGGTGGHIYPAVAVAEALEKKLGDMVELLFVGAEGKMEMEKIPALGYRIEGLPVAGLQRKLSLANLSLPAKIGRSLSRARRIIRDFDADVVAGFGGYASAPVLWSAQGMGIPTLIQEQNSYAGLTNKIMARRARKICVAYDGMERFFPEEKIVKTGNPLRGNFTPAERAGDNNRELSGPNSTAVQNTSASHNDRGAAAETQKTDRHQVGALNTDHRNIDAPKIVDQKTEAPKITAQKTEEQKITAQKTEALEFFGLEAGKPVILILGGSLGTRTLNNAMKQWADTLISDGRVQVIWQTGRLYEREMTEFMSLRSGRGIWHGAFIERMDLAYRAADVVISRSGANTVSELCLVGLPVIFVPSPNVSEDHQTKNAMALCDRGAALSIPDKEAVVKAIPAALEIIDDRARLTELSANIQSLAITGSADRIADLIIELADSKK